MSLKIYTYKNCGTCQKALKFLGARKIPYENIPIREQPPTKEELRQMLHHVGGEIRKLFNTSGMDYKALNLKDKLPKMTQEKAITLLASNGNLVKRPFVIASNKSGWVGFDMKVWVEHLKTIG